MPLNIIVRKKGPDGKRRFQSVADEHRKVYYQREISQGSRWRSKAGSKNQIKKVLDDASDGIGYS
jgi:hypothetical protein